jgi:hypothetical protein
MHSSLSFCAACSAVRSLWQLASISYPTCSQKALSPIQGFRSALFLGKQDPYPHMSEMLDPASHQNLGALEQCCGPGSGIWCFFDPWIWIRDGINRIRDPVSRINIPDPQHCFTGLSNPRKIHLNSEIDDLCIEY